MRCMMMLFLCAPFAAAQVVTFEDLALPPNSSMDGAPFTSGGAMFSSAPFEGFSASNVKDTTTAGFTNQYAAFVNPLPPDPLGAGAGASANYAIAYDPGSFGTPPTITFPVNTRPISMAITNTTYANISMRDGDPPGPFAFAKKFGGTSGNDPDFFKLTIKGYNASGGDTGTAVEFYLADYRSANNALDYRVENWTDVSLAGLSDDTRSLEFTLTSSDVGANGINTPAYFAADNIVYAPVPEPLGLGLIILLLAGAHATAKRR